MFRYFAAPHEFSTYSAEPQRCDLCPATAPGYEGPFYGDDETVLFVCEPCLAAGKLETRALATNNGDESLLLAQLENSRPDLSAAEREALARDRTRDLERATPQPVTWQDFAWPVHCSDYARYVKEVGQADLNGLAEGGHGRGYLATRLVGDSVEATMDEDEVDKVWDRMRPDAPSNNRSPTTMTVSLFECLRCKTTMVLWDCD